MTRTMLRVLLKVFEKSLEALEPPCFYWLCNEDDEILGVGEDEAVMNAYGAVGLDVRGVGFSEKLEWVRAE